MSIDYTKLSEITITNQSEMDAIPDNFKGKIYINSTSTIAVNNSYYCRVVANGNSTVIARGNSCVAACENSSVEAWENASVEAWENASVVARENSSVEAWENASVEARESASVEARENSSVIAWENSSVVARGNSSVVAWENASVEAWESSSVEAKGNASVIAWEDCSVVADGNSQIVNCQGNNDNIKVLGNARMVFMPKDIHEFMSFYGIRHTNETATFYKAVHKDARGYYSNYSNDFRYDIGETVTDNCDTNTKLDCGAGIHIAHLNWTLDFGKNWDNLAILEVSTDIADIVMPEKTDGKVRTSKIKVIREVLLEECGIYGKILAKRRTTV